MAGLKIKKGDRVLVLTGKDRGKSGEVMKALPAEGKVIVGGVNVAKKHQRQTNATMQAGIIDKDMPIPVANVALICPSCGKHTRVGYRVDAAMSGSQRGMAKLEFTNRTPSGNGMSSKRASTGEMRSPAGRFRAASWRSASGSESTATTRQPRRSSSTMSRPSPQPRSTASVSGDSSPKLSSAVTSVRRGGRSRSCW